MSGTGKFMPLINKVASPLRDAATMESSRDPASCVHVCVLVGFGVFMVV